MINDSFSRIPGIPNSLCLQHFVGFCILYINIFHGIQMGGSKMGQNENSQYNL
jgi:hypothetical protein